ncbi:MAG: DUF1343 domain-containing protein [Deltaproteobacteria bacterium]|nr:MAG: DUF1343 domain-containing protein [Deltaproteobacteria bacterium]
MTPPSAIPHRALALGLLALSLLASASAHAAPPVRLGVDVLLDERIELVRGKRVGLVTNAAAVDGALVGTADRLAADPRVELVQLYAPEHGLRGALAAGEKIADTVDAATGVPVEALFGKRRRPTAASLARLDVLLFDLQDVGSRTYTYASTLGEAMTAAAAAKVPFIVLDRPNPLGGRLFEGPVRDDAHKSFLGWGPVPVTHGMTFGELARLYEGELGLGCDLTVVPMTGWRRDMTWDDTGLVWVPTSPGIPHALNAYLYVATGMFAGVTTNVNEGVGTTQPFELTGASFVDPAALTRAMNAAGLPGVTFRPTVWRPYYHRFKGQILGGVQLVVTDPHRFRPLRTALTLMTTVERLHPGTVTYRDDTYVARIWGTTTVLPAVRAGQTPAALEASWADALEAFAATRARYLLYGD